MESKGKTENKRKGRKEGKENERERKEERKSDIFGVGSKLSQPNSHSLNGFS